MSFGSEWCNLIENLITLLHAPSQGNLNTFLTLHRRDTDARYVLLSLQRHLSNEEFQAIFHVSRLEFYRLPEWRRNDMKRRVKLF